MGQTLKKVEKREIAFLDHLELVKKQNSEALLDQLGSALQKIIQPEGCEKLLQDLKANPDSEVEVDGFVLDNFMNKKHVYFQAQIGGRRLVISYLLKSKKNKIMTLQIV